MAVVHSRSSAAEAITLSPSSSPHSPKPLLEVRMMLPLSYRADVGEADSGCTGASEFHEILNARFTVRDSFNIPQYPHRHDRCHHFTRRTSS